jgi:hypothetical protein
LSPPARSASSTLLDRFGKYGQRPSVAKLGAFETAITNNDMIKIAMLENYFRSANFYAITAIGAFIFEDYVGAVFTSGDGILRTSCLALAALRADLGLELAWLRKFSLYTQAGLLWIYLLIMGDGANLRA